MIYWPVLTPTGLNKLNRRLLKHPLGSDDVLMNTTSAGKKNLLTTR